MHGGNNTWRDSGQHEPCFEAFQGEEVRPGTHACTHLHIRQREGVKLVHHTEIYIIPNPCACTTSVYQAFPSHARKAREQGSDRFDMLTSVLWDNHSVNTV